MECRLCGITKLPNEFAPETVTEQCFHPTLFCLRCTLKAVKDTSKCPHQDCNQPAKLSDEKMLWFQAILDNMFKEYDAVDEYEQPPGTNALFAGGILTVTVLTGESMAVPYDPNMEVLQLKRKICMTMNHPIGKQKLLYMEKELTDYNSDGRRARILDFGVKPDSTLCLVIILFSVPENFDHVVFDLFWGYPYYTKRDYLDASCLMFSGTKFNTVCDYSHDGSINAVRHSGDMMDDKRRIGHHTINVSLQQMPSKITHLFFCLSAWNSPDISRYPNPSLKFYEASDPTKDLCKTTFHHARASQAVLMCSVSRGSHGRWEIFESGKLSAGNANNYGPVKKTIESLISQGF